MRCWRCNDDGKLENCYTSITYIVTMGRGSYYGVVMSYGTWIKGMLLLVQVIFLNIYKYILYSCCYVNIVMWVFLAVNHGVCSLAIFCNCENSSITSAFFYILKSRTFTNYVVIFYSICALLGFQYFCIFFFFFIWITAIDYLVCCRLKIRWI